MQHKRALRIVIVGGGTSGWMTAAALRALVPSVCTVHLIEAQDIPVVGVGEATLPHLRAFLTRLGIDEAAFMQATGATYKLGIEFCDFAQPGDRYMHPFGTFGTALNGVGFHHYWLRARRDKAPWPIDAFSAACQMARQCRFAMPGDDPDDPTTTFGYAYHFDAVRFAPFLRDWAMARGARRTEGTVVSVSRHALSGDIESVQLADGRRVEGDLFVDCTGFRARLIDAEMGATWQDWSAWLPCDSAVAAPCAALPGPVTPFTRATAMPAGWRWRIPLQHRIGNGYVYSSAHMTDAHAQDALVQALESAPLAEPRHLHFRAGRRDQSWTGNVVAIGLASGFLEPLESTSIYLIQAAITQLLEHLPEPKIDAADRDGFNAAIDLEYDRIRDFLILHYHASQRADSAFWNDVRSAPIPDSLAERIALWRRTAHVAKYDQGLFLEASWIAVYLGQGIVPQAYDQRADLPDAAGLERAMSSLHRAIAHRVQAMPDHRTALGQLGASAGTPA